MTAAVLGSLLGIAFCTPATLTLANRFARTPAAYPRLEVVGVGVVVGAALAVGAVRHGLGLALLLGPLAVLGGAAAMVDAREFRLPDPLLAALAVLAVGVVAASATGIGPGFGPPTAAFAIGVGLSALMLALVPRGWGWGDAKLLPLLAVWLGLVGPAAVMAAGVLTLLSLVPVAAWRQRRSPRAPVPYGPALVGATLLGFAVG